MALTCFSAVASQNIVILSGTPGDYISQGKTNVYSDIQLLSTNKNGVSFTFSNEKEEMMSADFIAPGHQMLQKGVYDFASRFPFQEDFQPGMNISGAGRGCNQLGGKYIVRDVHYDTNGNLKDLAVDFIQYCENRTAYLTGTLRYNSLEPIYFLEK
ncbi:hypothetical protein [Legionella impletisoli]|uniref:Uncharacterized protein n=1 Tax=Legionella impletisoli TaxID=343510 RepID=A0A917JP72_9GAMM|nr:hypothetical protein [Legionella impletisoli]GGI76457.1 hypothetical protein GCM10007966_01530 [Legionella impletisoli]